MNYAELIHTTAAATYHTAATQLPSQVNTPSGAATGIGIFIIIVYLALIVFYISASWRLFTKAGQPGWAAIVPIYNAWVLLKIVGRPDWWLILFFIPFVNIIFAIIVINDLSKSFGHDAGFTVGLVLLGFIFSQSWLSASPDTLVRLPYRASQQPDIRDTRAIQDTPVATAVL